MLEVVKDLSDIFTAVGGDPELPKSFAVFIGEKILLGPSSTFKIEIVVHIVKEDFI